MKYKLLLMGSNEIAIDDFFIRMNDNFELMSTSLHYQDIKLHVKYFQPDAIVFCLNMEQREILTRLTTLKKEILHSVIPIIILGDHDDCVEFCKIAVNVAAYILEKPLTAAVIAKRITEFLDQLRAIQAEEQMLELENKAKQEESDAVLAPEEQEQPDSGKPAEKKRILIVDDDVRMLKVIKAHVEEKYTASTAVSGKIALRFLERKHVDLILLDYEMPEMSGPEVLENLRKKVETADIPVIFLTGASEREKIAKALSLKPKGYLLKPVDKNKLMDKIVEVIG